ncbi:MAG: DUF4271 domain-containing protein [Bacteroidetes bacterium]|nr:MAG: DUF4271 domain-containing protein [Bacteroidota bacterium]
MILLQNIEISKYHYQPGWVLVIIVLSLMLLGYLYAAFNSRFNTFLKVVFLSRYSVQASREDRSLSHPVSLLLSLNFILVSSLFILQLFSSGAFFHSEIKFSFLSFFLTALTILLVYFVKIIFLKTIAFVLAKQEIMTEYNFTLFLVYQFLGVVLVPIVIFIAYGPGSLREGFIFLGLALFLTAFLLRVGKGLSAVLEKRQATLFYLILYLCTLEILPLLIVLKLFEKLV